MSVSTSEHKNEEAVNGKNGKEKESRVRVAGETPWATTVGFSRAVRCGNMIFVSGTTAANEKGEVSSPSDPKDQTVHTLKNIDKALRAAGSAIKDVVQTRIYVADIDHWEEIGKAHAEFFKDVKPATSMVEVSSLVHPDMLVEIEAVAVVNENGNGNGNGNGHSH